MNWKEFLEEILEERKLSTYELAGLVELPQPTIHRILSGDTKVPNKNTIRSLCKGLNININSKDPDNITYTTIEEKQNLKIPNNDFSKLKGTRTVGFVDSISKEVEAMQNNVAAYTIIDSDDTDLFEPGEEILINKKKQISNNDIVVVKLKNGKVKIKRCIVNESFIILADKNLNIEQINLNDIDCIFSFYGKIVTNIN